MAQVIPTEILDILALRGQYKTSEKSITFPDSAVQLINEIRKEIPSGRDGDGWHTVGANWRSPVKTSNFMPTIRGAEWERRVTKNTDNSSGGDFRPRFTNRNISTNTATQPVIQKAEQPQQTQQPQQPVIITTPHQKYTSRFKNVEEKIENTIVNTIILNKLNKFSPTNYNDVKEFLMEILGSGEREFLSDFMRLIFSKAAAEETFCPLYAKLLKELSAGYPFLLNEMNSLYHKFIDIFNEVNEADCKDMEEFIKKNKEKKYRHGYSQFLAELLKNDVVNNESFIETLDHLITQIGVLGKEEDKSNILDEYTGSLLKILTALKNHEAAKGIRDSIKSRMKEQLQPYTVKNEKFPSITNKIRFAILDAYDCLI